MRRFPRFKSYWRTRPTLQPSIRRCAFFGGVGISSLAFGAAVYCERSDSKRRSNGQKQHKFRVFSGSGHPQLAARIAEELGVELGAINVGKFADGETRVQIAESVRGLDIYIIQPACPPTNDNLMELLLMISTFRRSSANRVTAVIPYFGYARQDRMRVQRETIAAADVVRMLETVGVDRVIAVDLHRAQLEGFFKCSTEVVNLSTLPIGVSRYAKESLEHPVIVCPSITGVSHAKKFRDMLIEEGIFASLAFVTPFDDTGIMDPEIGHHHRISPEVKDVLVGHVKHCDVIIVDDMIDTGSRITSAAKAVKEAGARRVFAYATHGVFSGDCLNLIDEAPLTYVTVTDTIPEDVNLRDKGEQLSSSKVSYESVAPLIADCIRRMQIHQSMTKLVDP